MGKEEELACLVDPVRVCLIEGRLEDFGIRVVVV